MQTRPKPTRRLIGELVGVNRPNGNVSGAQGILASTIHHGLAELPMGELYPFLNLDEALAFAAGSWHARDVDHVGFGTDIADESLHEIFQRVNSYMIDAGQYSRPQQFENAFHWINTLSNLSDEMRGKHKKLNPFEGNTLGDRLALVPGDTVEGLRTRLQRDVTMYAFGVEFRSDARATPVRDEAERRGRRVIEMVRYQKVFPRRGEVTPGYVNEINRILGEYLQGLADLREPVEPIAVIPGRDGQLPLALSP